MYIYNVGLGLGVGLFDGGIISKVGLEWYDDAGGAVQISAQRCRVGKYQILTRLPLRFVVVAAIIVVVRAGSVIAFSSHDSIPDEEVASIIITASVPSGFTIDSNPSLSVPIGCNPLIE